MIKECGEVGIKEGGRDVQWCVTKVDLDAGREPFIYLDVVQEVLIADGRGEGIESEPGCYHC